MSTGVNLLVMIKEQKLYNATELAEKLGITRQALYQWIEKGWVKPRRDYRDFPVFTEEDVDNIIKWKNTIK